jgi:hypothetical protein
MANPGGKSRDGEANRMEGNREAGKLGCFLYRSEQHRLVVGTGQAPVLDLQTEELEGEALEFLQTGGSVPFSFEFLAPNQQFTRIQGEFLGSDDVANAVPDPSARRGAWDSELGEEIRITSLCDGPFEAMVVRAVQRHGALYDRLLSVEDSAGLGSNLLEGSTAARMTTDVDANAVPSFPQRKAAAWQAGVQRKRQP